MNCIVNANHVGTEYLTEYKDDKGELFYFRDIVTLRRLLKPKSVANNFLLPSASVH
ncbi:MAG: hypothetical protein HOM11_07955 [Methylococcales bacterium]|nr:hypothetical protein [Methylococcales bacterium]